MLYSSDRQDSCQKTSLNLYPIQIQSQLDHQFSSYERTNRLTDFFYPNDITWYFLPLINSVPVKRK